MNESEEENINIYREKIIFTGDSGVGKSSIINGLMGQPFEIEYEPSIGVDFFSLSLNYQDKIIKLQIWDSSGQEKFKSLIPNYIRGASLVLIVYDVNDRKTFDNLQTWIDFINNIENSNIVIIGNKIDINNRKVSKEEARTFCMEKNYEFFEVSANTGKNLEEMLFSCVASLSCFQKNENINKTKEKIVDILKNDNKDNIKIIEDYSNSTSYYSNNENNKSINTGIFDEMNIEEDVPTNDNSKRKRCCLFF